MGKTADLLIFIQNKDNGEGISYRGRILSPSNFLNTERSLFTEKICYNKMLADGIVS